MPLQSVADWRQFSHMKSSNLDAEWERAEAMLALLGRLAARQASDLADLEALAGEYKKSAYWQRITALIVASPHFH